jgi:hypothetical protein
MKDKYTFKVTYPDGEIEYWYNTVSETIAEMSRLQKLHDNKVKINLIKG